MFLLAATFYVSIGIRGHDAWVHALVTIPEHRIPIPYRDIPYAGQPWTAKTLDVHVRLRSGSCGRTTVDRFDVNVDADSRTFYGRLMRRPKP